MRLSKEGVATNILADRLKNLSANNIISFYHAADNRKTKYYFLTKKRIGIIYHPIGGHEMDL